MYTKEKIKDLQVDTKEWLKDSNGIAVQKNNLEDLRNILRFHEHRYYVENNPLISDFEYDQLYKKLENFEKEYPELITKDSPTQRVGTSLIKDFP